MRVYTGWSQKIRRYTDGGEHGCSQTKYFGMRTARADAGSGVRSDKHDKHRPISQCDPEPIGSTVNKTFSGIAFAYLSTSLLFRYCGSHLNEFADAFFGLDLSYEMQAATHSFTRMEFTLS